MFRRCTIKQLLLAVGLVTIIACPASAQKTIPLDTAHAVTLRISPADAMGGSASDIFNEINFIPLETTSESLFGSITQLEITDDRYIVYDGTTNCILFFDKKGKFLSKIKGKAGGPSMLRFSIDKWNKRIAYSTDDFETVNYADINGKLIRKIDVEKGRFEAGDFYSSVFLGPDQMISERNYHVLDVKSKKYNPARSALLTYIDNETLTAVGLPYDKDRAKIEAWGVGFTRTLTSTGGNNALFTKPFEPHIYSVTPNKIQLLYKLIFPAIKTLPGDFVTNPLPYVKHMEYVHRNPNLLYSFTNSYQIGNNLLFRASAESPSKEDNMIYNLKSGSLIVYQHISPDGLSFMLPLFDEFGNSFMNTGLDACDGKYIYTNLSSLCMFKNHDDHADQKIKYNLVLTEYFAKRSKKDNPVILQLKVKDQL